MLSHGSLVTVVVDTGCSKGMCNDRSLFRNLDTKCQQYNISGFLPGGKQSRSQGIGGVVYNTFGVNGDVVELVLKDQMYVPDGSNLVAVLDLVTQHGFTFVFAETGSYVRTPTTTIPLLACPKTRLCLLPLATGSNVTALAVTSTLQHVRFGHLNYTQLARMQRLGLVKGMVRVANGRCSACGVTKSKHRPVKQVTDRDIATTRLGLVHGDVVSFESKAFGDYRYALVLVDDLTRMCFVYLLKRKSDVAARLVEFKLHVADKHDLTIDSFRFDNGGEFRNGRVSEWASSNAIKIQFTAPFTPAFNGVAERFIGTLVATVRASLRYGGRSLRYWGFAILAACYLKNLSGTNTRDATPFFLFTGAVPCADRLRALFCPADVHIDPPASKLANKARRCIFVGYDESSPAWLFWDPVARKLRRSYHALFYEATRGVPLDPVNARCLGDGPAPVAKSRASGLTTIFGGGIGGVSGSASATLDLDATGAHDDLVGATSEHDDAADDGLLPVSDASDASDSDSDDDSDDGAGNTRRPTRSGAGQLRPQPTDTVQYDGSSSANLTVLCFLTSLAFLALTSGCPTSHRDAMSGADAATWVASEQEEMDSHIENGTFVPIPRRLLPAGTRCLPLFWIYKVKQDENGLPVRAKSRLVAGGHRAVAGVHYQETHAPTVHFASTRLLLSISHAPLVWWYIRWISRRLSCTPTLITTRSSSISLLASTSRIARNQWPFIVARAFMVSHRAPDSGCSASLCGCFH
jgi:hypothetical protein